MSNYTICINSCILSVVLETMHRTCIMLLYITCRQDHETFVNKMMIVKQGFLPVASRQRYYYDSILDWRCVQAGNLIKHVRSGKDLMMWILVTTVSVLMSKRWNRHVARNSMKTLSLHYKASATYHFLLPVGGPMIISKYWHVDLISLGVLSNICRLDNVYFGWRERYEWTVRTSATRFRSV